MRALLLAAGVGKRLKPWTDAHPKVLLPLDDAGHETLLARHFAAFRAAGITEVVVVVGHQEKELRVAIARETAGPPVYLRSNPRYRQGSLLSLWMVRELLAEGALIMDADVLYPPSFLTRLVQSPHPDCFLLDAAHGHTGEEMLLGVRDSRVREIGRPLLRGPYELTGEGVGFAKVSPATGRALAGRVEFLERTGLHDAEYEAALDQILAERPFGYELVSGEPWTEIDFPGDVEKARTQILPRLRG